MPELNLATNAEVIEELLGRESFAGVVVVADLGDGGVLDKAYVHFANSLASMPPWRKHELLTKAKQYAEGLHSNPPLT